MTTITEKQRKRIEQYILIIKDMMTIDFSDIKLEWDLKTLESVLNDGEYNEDPHTNTQNVLVKWEEIYQSRQFKK
jgi:hypothetical protein